MIRIACLLTLLLMACSKPPQPESCMDPCSAIGVDTDHVSLQDPNSKYWQERRRQCDYLRLQKHWSPCKDKAAD